jgi:hypothetical protein
MPIHWPFHIQGTVQPNDGPVSIVGCANIHIMVDSIALIPTQDTVTPLSATSKSVSWVLITCDVNNTAYVRVIGRSQARNADGILVSPAPTSGGKALANGETTLFPALGNAQPYNLAEIYVITGGSGADKVDVLYGSN